MKNSSVLTPVAYSTPDRFVARNATLPPYGDEYAEFAEHLYVGSKANRDREVVNDLADRNPRLEEKPGPKSGWLPDDELTQEWLELVEQYRADCDAEDRRHLLNDSPPGEAIS
jgi:hypothetical protein